MGSTVSSRAELDYFDDVSQNEYPFDLTLVQLNFSGNTIQEKDIIAISNMLRLDPNWRELNFTGNEIEDKGVHLISSGLQQNSNLRQLHLTGNDITDEGARSIANCLKKNSSLLYLYLERNKIGSIGAKELSEALKINSTLRRLNLYRNSIGDEGVKYLSEMLSENKSLTKLELYGNNITDKGAAYLSEALKKNVALKELSIEMNEISNKGIQCLAESFLTNETLTKLDVCGNPFSYEGAKQLFKSLESNKSLNTLILECIDLVNEKVSILKDLLNSNKSLTELSLYSKIGDNGVKAISDALKINNTLEIFNLEANDIGNEGAHSFADVLNFNNSLTKLNLSDNLIKDDGALSFVEPLRKNLNITEIKLTDNNVSEQIIGEINTIIEENLNKNRRTFKNSHYRRLYAESNAELYQFEILAAVKTLIHGYQELYKDKISSQDASNFMKRLHDELMQKATLSELKDEIATISTRLWSSALDLKGTELCSIINHVIRQDIPELLPPIVTISRGLNALCVTRYTLHKHWPKDNRTYRGGGFPKEHRDFFQLNKKYRAPMFVATTFNKLVAQRFCAYASRKGFEPVLWHFLLDEILQCVNVSYLTKSNVEGEDEFLFTAYSTFVVDKVSWKDTPSEKDPHEIYLRVQPDNQLEPEDLPLAPWC